MAGFRVAIIGYGSAGRGIHARLAREAGFEVTVILTQNRNRRQQAAVDWPGAKLVGSLDELIALRDRFDVAVVASPTGLHAENAAELARAGIPFVVDKPLGVDAFEVRAIIAEAASTKTPFTVFQNRRWDAEQLALVAALKRGTLGDVHTYEKRWERWQPVARSGWREADLTGGGLLLDLGSHLVDAATQLFGPPVRVTARLRSLVTNTDDDVFVMLEYSPGGGIAKSPFAVESRLFAGSLVAAPGPRTKVLGTDAAFVVTSYERDVSVFEIPAEEFEPNAAWITRGTDVEPVAMPAVGHVDFYAALPAWLAGDGAPPVDPRDALTTAIIMDAARASSQQGRSVAISKDGFK